jgi:hypothetical protein
VSSDRAVKLATYIGVLVAILAFARDVVADGITPDGPATPPAITTEQPEPPENLIDRLIDERLRELDAAEDPVPGQAE